MARAIVLLLMDLDYPPSTIDFVMIQTRMAPYVEHEKLLAEMNQLKEVQSEQAHSEGRRLYLRDMVQRKQNEIDLSDGKLKMIEAARTMKRPGA
jgi:hypothetical protein